jgi:hypothetical protein
MSDILKGTITDINLYDKMFKCDIELPLNEDMSANFELHEFIDPLTRLLIYNPLLHIMLQTLRTEKKWTIIIESLYRGDKYNELVGGEDGSRHKTGSAVDFKAFVKDRQIDPIHVAYALYGLLERFGIQGGIGTYMKAYKKGSLGFNHFDVRQEPRSLWVCYKSPTLVSISDLSEIKI